jgi:hypothetical protein
MSTKASFPLAILLTAVGLWTAHGQDSLDDRSLGDKNQTSPQAEEKSPSTAEALPQPAETLPMPREGLPAPGVLTSPMSSWIIHNQANCCSPFGGDGPINTELYVDTGPSIPVAGGILHHIMETGWDIRGGGRSLFFNPAVDAAWTIDLSLSYIFNHARPNPKVPLTGSFGSSTPTLPAGPGVIGLVTLRDLNRTFVNGAAGREWYLNAPANAAGWKWRAGFDLGGGIGSGLLNFVDIRHKTDTIYDVVISLHTDLEVPYGCCTFTYGFRAEWDYTWMDVIQRNNAQLQDVNLLATFGVRF